LARFLLNLFYERIEVVGGEHIPPAGPLVVAANHHNSVVDAMLLLAVMPRALRTLANAPLFRHPLFGPLLRLVGALPVNRRQEAGNDPTRNAALFAATTATLQAGGAILIFPEGRTQPEPLLQELRTGTARMVLAAEADATDHPRVTLLPVGLVYQRPGTFRAGRAVVLVGAPIATADCLGLGQGATASSRPVRRHRAGGPRGTSKRQGRRLEASGPAGRDAGGPQAQSEQSARVLTDRLADALRGQIVEADDRHTLRLIGLAEELWREENGQQPGGHHARIAWLQQAMRTYRCLLERAPEQVAAFRQKLEAFDAEIERAGLAVAQLSRDYSPAVVARFALREGASVLLGAPLALGGMAAHFLPYQLTAVAVRLIPHTDEEEATDKIAAGLVLFPLAWAVESYAVFAIGGFWPLVLFLAALLPTGFFAMAWRERLERVGREARAFVRYLRDHDLPRRLRQHRQALVSELAALARIVPEVWPE
jgi:1-acyl-sn-glycerol-3-phosphate acyltransferase